MVEAGFRERGSAPPSVSCWVVDLDVGGVSVVSMGKLAPDDPKLATEGNPGDVNTAHGQVGRAAPTLGSSVEVEHEVMGRCAGVVGAAPTDHMQLSTQQHRGARPMLGRQIGPPPPAPVSDTKDVDTAGAAKARPVDLAPGDPNIVAGDGVTGREVVSEVRKPGDDLPSVSDRVVTLDFVRSGPAVEDASEHIDLVTHDRRCVLAARADEGGSLGPAIRGDSRRAAGRSSVLIRWATSCIGGASRIGRAAGIEVAVRAGIRTSIRHHDGLGQSRVAVTRERSRPGRAAIARWSERGVSACIHLAEGPCCSAAARSEPRTAYEKSDSSDMQRRAGSNEDLVLGSLRTLLMDRSHSSHDCDAACSTWFGEAFEGTNFSRAFDEWTSSRHSGQVKGRGPARRRTRRQGAIPGERQLLLLCALATQTFGGCTREVFVATRGENACAELNACQQAAGDQELARFRFDGNLDEVEGRATLVGIGEIGFGEGPGGCDEAVRFGEEGYLVLDDSPAWDVSLISVSFWFFAPACGAGESFDATGLISRDADLRQQPGHFTVGWTSSCSLWIRLQRQDPEEDTIVSAPADPGRWHHVQVRVGPPNLRLWVDGTPLAEASTEATLMGNDNPWAFGANTRRSVEGMVTPIQSQANGFLLDEVRLTTGEPSCVTEPPTE